MSNKPKNILCVDDEPDVLTVAKMALETVGCLNVITASNGRECLEMINNIETDVILIDVMMPELDGSSTLTLLRLNPNLNHIPIIFMTARVRPSEIDEYLALGANGVVIKPFDPMTLSAQIFEICEKFQRKI